jgi:hypothetical protein
MSEFKTIGVLETRFPLVAHWLSLSRSKVMIT